MLELIKSGVCGKVIDGITLLATGGEFFKSKINLNVTRASLSAIKIIEEKGGSVTTTYTDRKVIHALLNPKKYYSIPEIFVPTSRRMIARYISEDRRGYLKEFKGIFNYGNFQVKMKMF
jgi:large subunit ribosomal protein L15